MSDFERYQAMMLDYAYGLLEPEQVVELEVFLKTCPEGEALRRQGEQWQRRLGAAAKAEFPDLRFTPPSAKAQPAKPAASKKPLPARNAGPSRPSMESVWTRWALAASVLAVVCGLGIPAVRHYVSHMDQAAVVRDLEAQSQAAAKVFNNYVEDYNFRRQEAAREEESARKAGIELNEEYVAKLKEAHRVVEEKEFVVRLSGPERAQPGAPNEWKVEMFKRNGAEATPTKVEWLVKDQGGKTLWSDEKKAPGRGRFLSPPTVSLPVSFWEKVKPDSDLLMEVTAYDETCKSQVNAKVGLARPVYVTHLATDKPLYKQGETVYFRSLTLDRGSFIPPESDMQLEFRVLGPDGSPVWSDTGAAKLFTDANFPRRQLIGPDKKPLRGLGCGEFPINPQAPGGEYRLEVLDVTPSFDARLNQVIPKSVVLESRKFNVAEYKPELFDKTLEFDGKSYGAGDVVMVKCTASRTQGGKLKRATVAAWANVDGQHIPLPPAKTDDDGVVRLKFTLPKNIVKGIGSLTVSFTDGNDSEPILRPIPIVGRLIKVEFFPEGGDLVENVPSRVYFQATTPNGKPADVKGYITDGGETVAEVATQTDADEAGVNRGQGVFAFTPKAGKKYYLKVRKPGGIIEPIVPLPVVPAAVVGGIGMANLGGIGALTSNAASGFALPAVKPDGVVLTALDAVSNPERPIRVRVQTGKSAKTLVVGAYGRGRLIDHQRAVVEPGKAVEVQLNPNAFAGGVTRLTVFEEKAAGENNGGQAAQLFPVAERLVYRRPAQQLILNVNPDRSRYNPGSQVSLDVQAVDEHEKPVPAVLMVAVVNQSVLSMADEKTGRLMPTHFLLASEVNKPEDLEHADFLLYDPENDRNAELTLEGREKTNRRGRKAAQALDLLLGTQGWRRFAEQHPETRQREEVERLLVSNGQRAKAPVETFRQEEDKVITEYQPKLEVSLVQLGEKAAANAAVQEEFPKVQAQTALLNAQRADALKRYDEAVAQLQKYETDATTSRSFLFGGLCLGLLGIAGVCVMVGVSRRGRRSVPYFATAAGSFALCALAVAGAVMLGRSADGARVDVAKGKRLAGPDRLAMATRDEAFTGAAAGMAPAAIEMEAADALKKADEMKQAGGHGGGNPDFAGRVPNMPVPAMAPGAEMAKAKMMPLKGGANGFDKDAKRLAEPQLVDGLARNEARALQRKPQGNLFRDRHNKDMEQLRNKAAFGLRGTAGPRAAEPAERAELAARMRLDQMNQLQEMRGFYVREFSFKKAGDAEVRNDFAETVYWHPVLVLPESGRREIQFQMSDSISRYQVLVAGHTVDGRIGAVTSQIEARKPFTVDPKLPIEITSSDRIDVPIRVVNDSDIQRAVTFHVTPNGLKPDNASLKSADGKYSDWIELAANQKGRKIMSFRPTKKEGEIGLSVVGTSDPMDVPDQIVRTFRVVPEGFPVAGAVSDLLEKRAFASFELPKDPVKGTLKVQVQVYPTTLADLQSGLDALLREPCGCFEQTSTSNYPNLLILDYLKSSDQSKPELAQRAKGLLDRGYNKLVGFECPKSDTNDRRGFEWFGQADRQHQALTAYGLLQFKDLAKVHKVDPELIKRTQLYLLGQQNDNKDGFKRNQTALDTFGRAPDYITNAYIVWALVESDPDDKEEMTDLLKQLDFLKKHAKEHPQGKKDPYFLALVANALLHRPTGGNRDAAVDILGQIADNNLVKGCVEGATTSITCSGGRDLQIESTALAVLGWLRCGEPAKFVKPVKEATKWIGQQRGGYGGFGSTQSTILALKALIEYTKQSRKPAEDGEYRLTVNGKTFKKSFTAKDQEVITLEIEKPEEVFRPGKNEATLEITTKQAYPFSLSWSCSTLTPVSSEKCAVEIAATLDRNQVVEGETVKMNVSLRNKVKEGHGMAVAIVGLPGGARLPADMKELTKLREEGTISYFEIRGRELVLYWRSLKPEQKIDLSFGLICEVPGEFRGPASRGYLYYNADPKHWIEPLSLSIAPSNQPGKDDVAAGK